MLKFFKSRFFFTVSGALFIFTIFLLGQQIVGRYHIEKEITELETQIFDLESGNQELVQLIEYFNTMEYRERQARSLLNLQKAGEFAVALPSIDEENGTRVSENDIVSDSNEDNPSKWWKYFFDIN